MEFLDDLDKWVSLQDLPSQKFVCGYCSLHVSSILGYKIVSPIHSVARGGVYICPDCDGAVFVTPKGDIFPGPLYGREVKHLPEDIGGLYKEARQSIKEKCYTGAVLLCRKMLMNIAVSEGADKDMSFLKYVEYLSDHNYIPPRGEKWVDYIRTKGNEANHEIALMKEEDAKYLLSFTEGLLRFIYEFSGDIKMLKSVPSNSNKK